MLSRFRWIVLGLSLGLLQACMDSGADAPAAQPYYHVAAAQPLEPQTSYRVTREFAGIVQARQRAELGFELAGTLAELSVDEGEAVSAGTVIARLDTALLTIARSELQAQIAETRARLSLVESNLSRLRKLRPKGFSSEQGLDELQAERNALQATLGRQHAALAANATRLEKSELTAPFSGVVGARFADQGMVVAAGAPVVRLLESIREARIGLPPRLLEHIQPGRSYPLQIDERTIQAEALAVGAELQAQTRTVTVRFALPPDAHAVDGQLVYLTLEETIPQPGYWVPISALRDGVRGLWTLYSLQAAESEALFRIVPKDVQIHHLTRQRAYVSASLAGGEWIVATGIQRLSPGQLVRRVSAGDVEDDSIALGNGR